MAYTNRPRFLYAQAFNADPNDPAATPSWTDLTTSLRTLQQYARGRQYELGTTLTASPIVGLRDVSETINPDNTGSALYGQILPYRGALLMGTWPNPSAGNLINTGAWRVAMDPGFESYGLGVVLPWMTAVGGVVATVTTATPHAGTKDYTWAVANGATVQGVQWTVYTMPGTQYTVSAYVQQASASTQGIYADGSVGTTTVTTGAYVRLTKTFTATQPTTVLAVLTSGTAVAGTVNLDDIQLEEGAAASVFTTTGSVVYPIFKNYAERYTRTWDSQGFEGKVEIPCVDGFAALAATQIYSEYREAVTGLLPDFYWPLDDPSGTTQWLEQSGNNGPPMVAVAAKYGPGAGVTAAASIAIVGDAGATGVNFPANASPNSTTEAMTILACGNIPGILPGVGQIAWPSNITPTWSASVSCWMTGTPTAATIAGDLVVPNWGTKSGPQTNPLALIFGGLSAPGNPIATYQVILSAGGLPVGCAAVAGGVNVGDGKPHHMVGTVTQDVTNTTTKVYADGVLVATQTLTTAGLGGPIAHQADGIMLGGTIDKAGQAAGSPSGTVAHVALWSRALSAGEVTTLWTAGGLGYSGETSGTRIGRHLALGDYTAPTRISAGSTTMGPPTYQGSIDLYTDSQNTTTAEGGCMWMAPDGAYVFEGRQDRWLRLTPSYTLGENVAGGELPYNGGIEYDYDPQFLFANVSWSRNGGATGVGGTTAEIATARKRFFGRTFGPQGSDFATDQQAADAANWTFYTHNRPITRINAIVLDPASNPVLWPFCLSVEIGQRIRVIRRPKAANAGAGITITQDFFVENVAHDGVDLDAGTWWTILLLSPVGTVTNQAGMTLQPWIIEDATLGVLDSTTVLGW